MTATTLAMTFDQALRLAIEPLARQLLWIKSPELALTATPEELEELYVLTGLKGEAAFGCNQLSCERVLFALQSIIIDLGQALTTARAADPALRITISSLPKLRDLYESAKARVSQDHRSERNYRVDFNLDGLLWTVQTALKQIPAI